MTAKKQWTLNDLDNQKLPERRAVATALVAARLPHGRRYVMLQDLFIAWGVPITAEYLRKLVCLGNRVRKVRDPQGNKPQLD